MSNTENSEQVLAATRIAHAIEVLGECVCIGLGTVAIAIANNIVVQFLLGGFLMLLIFASSHVGKMQKRERKALSLYVD